MSHPALRRILVVDDQRVMRSIAEFSLGKMGGFALHICASGEEAIAAAATFMPDLLLLDMNMPQLDGVQTLQELRARGVAAPVVFFTAKVGAADMERFNGLGALGVVPKPFDPLKLPGQLQELWKQYHDRLSPRPTG
jgi:two-component system OmpR family response regulator